MARRRLAPVDPARVDPAPADGVSRAERSGGFATAPIAHIAGDGAMKAAYEEMAETLRTAREEGRFVLELPLDEVAADHLVRDRIRPGEAAADEEMAALVESIRAHGQRTPIEVTPLDPRTSPLPYGLVSGWRRLSALKALRAETGEARFATVRALVLTPENAEAAYVAMVEENEIRVGLSPYERARIAALAAERGVFPDEEAAVRALFATASRPKRSRIRAFLKLYHALDGALRFPQAIPERLGLRLVERVRTGEGAGIAAAVAAAAAETPEAELALLDRLAAAPRREAAVPDASEEEVRPGVTLGLRRRGGTLTLTLTGIGVTPALAAELRAMLAQS